MAHSDAPREWRGFRLETEGGQLFVDMELSDGTTLVIGSDGICLPGSDRYLSWDDLVGGLRAAEDAARGKERILS
jgi:hypothetical protein